MSLKWWEKTVEYKFVMDVADEGSLILAPLDGDHEKAADTAIGKSELWLMIEFKKDLAAVKSEIIKFENFKIAKDTLISQDSHHHIIFGSVGKNEKQVDILKMNYTTYFSWRSNDLKSLLNSGKPLKEFNDYLKKFTAFKKTEKKGVLDTISCRHITGYFRKLCLSPCTKSCPQYPHYLQVLTKNICISCN